MYPFQSEILGFKEVVIHTYESADIIWCYSHLRVLIFYDHLHATLLFLFFCYAPKRPRPFSLYIQTKNPLFNDKVWIYYRILVSKRVISQKKEKTGPPTNPATGKISFIIVIQPFYWCQQNARKNITVTVSIRVSVTIRGTHWKWCIAREFSMLFQFVPVIFTLAHLFNVFFTGEGASPLPRPRPHMWVYN